MEDKIFVYGTLMRGNKNPVSAKFHRENEYICEGFVYGRLYKISWYPGLIVGGDIEDKVYGEVFRLSNPAKSLAMLDAYEGIRTRERPLNQYERRLVRVYGDSGELTCWTYIFLDEAAGENRILSGRF